jgi:hypothetical protein
MDLIWSLISKAVLIAPVTRVDEKNTGIGCGVMIDLNIKQRISPVITAWHYVKAGSAPRLVTAYPTSYNRGNGRHA